MTSLFYPSHGARMLAAIVLKGRTGPSRGSQLFVAKASSSREAADKLECSKSFAAYLMSGERTPSVEMTERIAEVYGVPAATWCMDPFVREPSTGKWVPAVDTDVDSSPT